ncbi:MAG: hypothetical protein R3324_10130, partial [Halobacteriales archaeon]|nr:hypothetical protein [Halobacteriales archaeon]
MFRRSDESSRYRGSTVGRSEGRGQSELVAITLLLLVVILGSIVVAITGVGAIEDNKRTVAVSQAETSLQQLDS